MKLDFQNATHCFLCQQSLDSERVRDHCHYTGKYRGATHNNCNLETGKKEKRKWHIPVFLHNLKGYDSHHIMQALCQLPQIKNLSCIPSNSEKYIAFGFEL